MITIPKADKHDLTVFKAKRVVICGFNEKSKKICDVLISLNIDVLGFWDDSLEQESCKTYAGVSLLTTEQLKSISICQHNIIAQEISFDYDRIEQQKNKLLQLGIEVSPLEVGKIGMSLYPQYWFSTVDLENKFEKWETECSQNQSYKIRKFERRKQHNRVLICLPQKTADYTLMQTFNEANQATGKVGVDNGFYQKLCTINHKVFKSSEHKLYRVIDLLITPFDRDGDSIEFVNLAHRPKYIKKSAYNSSNNTVKIITAVRDPIAQNLSSLYQLFTAGLFLDDWVFGEIECAKKDQIPAILEESRTMFVDCSNDVQMMFYAFIKRYVYTNQKSLFSKSIQQFIPEFQNQVVDYLAYPFDKEKGYTIIKEGNLEVFVYQLEKLDHLVPELSEFVGVPFEQLVRGNDASDKWIADSYKQAQKEIQITQEYFDKCFNEPYVQHCYSQDDIEKFKEKWCSHITMQ